MPHLSFFIRGIIREIYLGYMNNRVGAKDHLWSLHPLVNRLIII